MSKTDLKNAIARHLINRTGASTTDEELSECADSLVSFFEILIEADKKLKIIHEPDRRNSNHTD